jgi:hypothetical protein
MEMVSASAYAPKPGWFLLKIVAFVPMIRKSLEKLASRHVKAAESLSLRMMAFLRVAIALAPLIMRCRRKPAPASFALPYRCLGDTESVCVCTNNRGCPRDKKFNFVDSSCVSFVTGIFFLLLDGGLDGAQ